MGPIWGRQDPGGPHVGPMNLAIWGLLLLMRPQEPAYWHQWCNIVQLHRWVIFVNVTRAHDERYVRCISMKILPLALFLVVIFYYISYIPIQLITINWLKGRLTTLLTKLFCWHRSSKCKSRCIWLNSLQQCNIGHVSVTYLPAVQKLLMLMMFSYRFISNFKCLARHSRMKEIY